MSAQATTPEVVLGSGADVARFDPADGFRLTALRLAGRDLLVTDRSRGEFWWGSFIMAPWTSDLTDGRLEFAGVEHRLPLDLGALAVHGVARKSVFTWRDGVAEAPLGHGWTLGGSVRAQPRVTPGRLDLTLEVVAGETAMPASIGWHPWLPRSLDGVRAELVVPPGALAQETGADGMPTGRWRAASAGPFNDCLRCDGPIEVRYPGVGTATVSWDGDFVTVFDANEHGVCVEPVTGPAHLADRILEPFETLRLTLAIGWAERNSSVP